MENKSTEAILQERCDRFSFLLGIAVGMISCYAPEDEKDWFINAIEEVVYKNNPVPKYE